MWENIKLILLLDFILSLPIKKIITKFDFNLDKLYALCIKISVDSFIYSFKITY